MQSDTESCTDVQDLARGSCYFQDYRRQVSCYSRIGSRAMAKSRWQIADRGICLHGWGGRTDLREGEEKVGSGVERLSDTPFSRQLGL